MALELRRARPEDADLLFRWVNDPVVRENSFQTRTIEYQNHLRWFTSRLQSPDCEIFILCDTEVSPPEIGQVRFERNADGAFEIDYSVHSSQRGKGRGNELVRLGLEQMFLKLRQRIKFIGRVKSANVASQRVFLKNDFTLEQNDAFAQTYIRICDV
ncbi:MAG: GNAT family N-acetyltransferase [Leptospirales bacterium]|nr:GNAT family N-acetyltransferase [Leptospirales bacterium]